MHRMLNRKFAEGRINARTTQDLYKSSAVVLGIPGGPGIPGQYLDQVTADLAKQFKAAPIVIDLPNHGLSAGSSSTEPIKYPEVRARIISLLTELKEARLSIVLLGHSLGALIALDLICHWPESSLRALLIAT